jgi:hypothetical protein
MEGSRAMRDAGYGLWDERRPAGTPNPGIAGALPARTLGGVERVGPASAFPQTSSERRHPAGTGAPSGRERQSLRAGVANGARSPASGRPGCPEWTGTPASPGAEAGRATPEKPARGRLQRACHRGEGEAPAEPLWRTMQRLGRSLALPRSRSGHPILRAIGWHDSRQVPLPSPAKIRCTGSRSRRNCDGA